MMKNNAILCTIVLMHSLSIGAMKTEFQVVDKNTMRPLGVLHNNQRLFFKTRLTALQKNPDDENTSIDEAEIVVLTLEDSQQNQPPKNPPAVHYYLVPRSEGINPVEIDKVFIDSMMTTMDQTSNDQLLFHVSNTTDPRRLGILRITKKTCEVARTTEPKFFAPIPKQEQKPIKKPKKVCDQEPEPENPIKPADLPKDFQLPFRQASEIEQKYSHKTPEKRQRRYFEEVGNNQYWHQDTLTKLYSSMQKENADAIKNHFDQTAQSFAHRIFEINKLSDNKTNATELSEKEKATKLLAQDMAYQYWSIIANNKDLNVTSFSEYADQINSNIRILDHRLSGKADGSDLSKTFSEVSNQSNLIIAQQQEHDVPFTQATERLKMQDNYRFPKAVLKKGLSLGPDVAIGVAMSTAGELAAASILSFVDNPEQTKYESDLKKGIKEGEEYLEKNSLENIRKKHARQRLEETQKNKQQFDIHNVEALDRKELAQKIKDLYEQQN